VAVISSEVAATVCAASFKFSWVNLDLPRILPLLVNLGDYVFIFKYLILLSLEYQVANYKYY
jgi:hypothetical protein